MDLQDKILRVKAFSFDVDGVLTDGSLFSTPEGDLIRVFHSHDGFAMRNAILNGYRLSIITGGESDSIVMRYRDMGIAGPDMRQRARNKLPEFYDWCAFRGLDPSEVAYFGDDVPDIAVLKSCGLAVCPSDAVDEVKEVCDIVTKASGGRGCVREALERIMRAQGTWIFNPEAHDRAYNGSMSKK